MVEARSDRAALAPSRRTFLGIVAVAAASVALPVGRAVLDRGPSTDGPELPSLAELPWIVSGGVLVGELVAQPSGAGLVYNGTAPGPLMRMSEGDRVRIEFRNDLDVDSSLHLHGVPLTPDVDRPLTHLGPGEADEREFELPAGSAGTYWYHPHAHGDVDRQIRAGLAGAVVVHGPLDRVPGLAEADDRLLMLTRRGREVVVNGAPRPTTTARSGRLRLRLLNATPGDHVLVAVLGAGRRLPLHQIATDGGLIGAPVRLEEILLAPGERAEVLVDAEEPGVLEIRSQPYSTYGPGGAASAGSTLMTVTVPADLPPVPALPTSLLPVKMVDPSTAVRTRQVLLGAGTDGTFTIDGRTFDHDRTDAHARLGTLEIWEVVNDHTSDHPFHLHSYPVQVLDRDGVPEPFPAWRDTVNVPARTRVRLAVPFVGGAGRTVYHCHITSHEDRGMMAVLDVTH